MQSTVLDDISFYFRQIFSYVEQKTTEIPNTRQGRAFFMSWKAASTEIEKYH